MLDADAAHLRADWRSDNDRKAHDENVLFPAGNMRVPTELLIPRLF